jgi:hypothetical protein
MRTHQELGQKSSFTRGRIQDKRRHLPATRARAAGRTLKEATESQLQRATTKHRIYGSTAEGVGLSTATLARAQEEATSVYSKRKPHGQRYVRWPTLLHHCKSGSSEMSWVHGGTQEGEMHHQTSGGQSRQKSTATNGEGAQNGGCMRRARRVGTRNKIAEQRDNDRCRIAMRVDLLLAVRRDPDGTNGAVCGPAPTGRRCGTRTARCRRTCTMHGRDTTDS